MDSARRYGIITDIHANLAALRAVLDAIAAEGITELLCMGDVVGYGPSPVEAIAELRKLPLHCIQGNHDRYTLGQTASEVRAATAEAIDYTRRVLSEEDMAFLRDLPDEQLFDGRILLAHGSPRDPDEYILSSETAITNYKYFRAEYGGVYVCLFGHTHIPMIVGDGKVGRQIDPGQTVKLKHMMPYLINPGSVGQPRDGNPDAAYGILDLEAGTFTFRRAAYDVEDTHRRILEAGLQRHLGDRLRLGK
jgi:diadenosine tetraphosphatase ApaH/serine/threonine PP2A family protein phosphatase